MKNKILFLMSLVPALCNATLPSGITIVPDSQMELPPVSKQRQAESLKQQVDFLTSLPQLAKSTSDGELKKDVSEIKLAFKYKPLPIDRKHIIAYVGAYAYREDGWTALDVYFEDDVLGVCNYNVSDMDVTRGGVQISEKTVRYDVNQYPNTLYVGGNATTGYVYNIDWFNKPYSKELECASRTYNSRAQAALIELAKKIG